MVDKICKRNIVGGMVAVLLGMIIVILSTPINYPENTNFLNHMIFTSIPFFGIALFGIGVAVICSAIYFKEEEIK